MYGDTRARLQATLDEIEAAGLTKHERRLTSPQAAHISTTAGEALRSVITHRFPAERFEDAFTTIRSGRCGKVILDWS